MVYFILAIIVCAGLYSVMITGVTGGPNHGEHPLIVTLIHFGIFYFRAESWPKEIYDRYFWLLVICVAASIIGYGSADLTRLKARFWLARGVFLTAYAGFVIVFLSRHGIISL